MLQRLGLPDEVVRQVDWSELDREVEPDHLTSLWIPRMAAPVGAGVAALDELMVRLRDEDPWKAEQDHETLKRYLLEETYEVLEAIDAYDPDTGEGADELCAELGDLLYQVVFHSAIAAEAGWFTLADVAGPSTTSWCVATRTWKLRVGPAALSGSDRTSGAPPSVEALVDEWESDKRSEQGRGSVMDDIPSAMPALARAMKVAKRAAALGDPPWPHRLRRPRGTRRPSGTQRRSARRCWPWSTVPPR